MELLIGRTREKKILEDTLNSSTSELIAVYGRRRVGKTYLIIAFYEKYIRFEFTGTHGANMQEQLEAFSMSLKKSINSPLDVAVL